MQRICGALLTLLPGLVAAQQSAGAALWRLAGTTLPIPPALMTGGAAALWNPAQPLGGGSERASIALEAIETAPAVGASGMLFTARARVKRVGQLGLVYGRMSVADLVPTSLSPDPDAGVIPYYTEMIGVNWGTAVHATTVGVTVARQNTHLDAAQTGRWTLDAGARRTFGGSEVVRVAAATHFFSHLSLDDPAQDVYAGAEVRLWRGPVWEGGSTGVIRARYGIAFGHGFTADHQFGLGFELDQSFGADVLVAREGSYGGGGWRPVAGIRVAIGRYRLSFARDAAFNDVGAAYRVGFEGRVR